MAKAKDFLITLFWKQNKYHQHGILIHTLRVFLETFKAGHYDMLIAALLHDIGKPFVAYQKDEDIINNEYSFTDHEEYSYQIIKSWPFLSDYTKNLVRYHYLIRRITKAKEKKKTDEYQEQLKIYLSLPKNFRRKLGQFLACDDKGKGNIKKKQRRT